MKKPWFLFVFLIFLSMSKTEAQEPDARILAYISTYKQMAIDEMLRSGVPASITLAQGIHETSAGQSELVLKSNNHFGIKCKTGWSGESVTHTDDAPNECFRKYADPADSYRDHSDFLKNSKRYAFLFDIDPADYPSWAQGLKKAGYATNPKYPQLLIKLIEDYHLNDYTLIALGKITDDPFPGGGITITGSADVRPPVPVVSTEEETLRYPLGEFRINEARVIYAKAGTSLLAIAEKYQLSLARVFEFNDMQETDLLEKDQLIFLQRKRKTGNNEKHFVKPGETVYDISQQEGIRLSSLLELNLLNPGMEAAPGQLLYLRDKAPAMPKLLGQAGAYFSPEPITQKDRNITLHTVQARETLYGIARHYQVSTTELIAWNALPDHAISIGQTLKIYKN